MSTHQEPGPLLGTKNITQHSARRHALRRGADTGDDPVGQRMHPVKVETEVQEDVLPAQVHTAGYQNNQMSDTTLS